MQFPRFPRSLPLLLTNTRGLILQLCPWASKTLGGPGPLFEHFCLQTLFFTFFFANLFLHFPNKSDLISIFNRFLRCGAPFWLPKSCVKSPLFAVIPNSSVQRTRKRNFFTVDKKIQGMPNDSDTRFKTLELK